METKIISFYERLTMHIFRRDRFTFIKFFLLFQNSIDVDVETLEFFQNRSHDSYFKYIVDCNEHENISFEVWI